VDFEGGLEGISDAEIKEYVGFLTWLGKHNVSYRFELLRFAKYIDSYQEPVSSGLSVSVPSRKR